MQTNPILVWFPKVSRDFHYCHIWEVYYFFLEHSLVIISVQGGIKGRVYFSLGRTGYDYITRTLCQSEPAAPQVRRATLNSFSKHELCHLLEDLRNLWSISKLLTFLLSSLCCPWPAIPVYASLYIGFSLYHILFFFSFLLHGIHLSQQFVENSCFLSQPCFLTLQPLHAIPFLWALWKLAAPAPVWGPLTFYLLIQERG